MRPTAPLLVLLAAACTGSGGGWGGDHQDDKAGDVDADGYEDVLIGAWGNDAGGTDAGAAYLILGG